jgi:hypothetical protein
MSPLLSQVIAMTILSAQGISSAFNAPLEVLSRVVAQAQPQARVSKSNCTLAIKAWRAMF